MALTEIREDQAPPEIAALYAALRQATGVPLVNLIHRHLATMPGVLPWVWHAIRPPLEDGTLAGARERLAASLSLPPLTRLPDPDWAAAGLTQADRARIAALAEVYNRGNLTNLILLTALRRAMEGTSPDPAPPVTPIPPPAMLPTPPSLPRLDALPSDTAALVRALAARHLQGGSGVIPSLYLHLAHWPPMLAALPRWLGPLLEPTELTAARDAAIRLAEREADALRPALALKGEIPGGYGPTALAAIAHFTNQVIPGMVPVGLALRRLL